MLAALITVIIGTLFFHELLLGVIGALLVLGSTADFWQTTCYRLDAKVAQAKCGLSITEIEWNRVKRVILLGNSIRLSPLAETSRMETFRGVLLRAPRAEIQNLLAEIQKRCDKDVRILGS